MESPTHPTRQLVRRSYERLLPAIPADKLEQIVKAAAKRFQAVRDAGFTGSFTADDMQRTLELEYHFGPNYLSLPKR
jgi:hypothetical protein